MLSLRAAIFTCLIAIALLAGHGVVLAAEDAAPAEAAAPVAPERVQRLVETLEDPVARDQLVNQLKTLAELEQKDALPKEPQSVDELSLGLVELLSNRINALVLAAVELSAVVVDLPDLSEWLFQQMTEPVHQAYWLEMLGMIALVLVLSFGAYHLTRRALRPTMKRFRQEVTDDLTSRLPVALLRGAIRLLPILAFGMIGYTILPFIGAQIATGIVAKSLVDASIVCLTLVVVARTVLAPSAAQLRLVKLSDETSRYLFRWLKRFIYLIAYSYVIFQNDLLIRIPASIYGGIERLLGFIVAIMLIGLVLANRKPVAIWLRGNGHVDDDQVQRVLARSRRLIADIWPVFAIFYVISTYLIWALAIPGGFTLLLRGAVLTTFLLAISRPLAYGVERALGRGLSLGPEVRRRYPALERRINRYLMLLQGFAVSLVYFAILLALVHVWGFSLFTWIGEWFSDETWSRLSKAGMMFLITFIIWEIISTLIENYLDAVDESGTRIERSGRARTLLPLLRTFLFLVIGTVVILTTLSTLGVDVTPVLAAAGVIGIAVGFGSQKLVQDFINGLFILFQDTIAIGEVVDVGGHSGLVENITVRTISLRDMSGRVHTIPFSSVTTITNHTKDFAYAEFDIAVAYREDTDEVMEVVRQLGADLEADPEFSQYMMEPIEVLGINSFTDSAIIIKARIKTKAQRQWYVKREFHRLMKYRFDELGIEIPFPHQTLLFGEDKEGRALAHIKVEQERRDLRANERSMQAKTLRVVNDDSSRMGDKVDE